MIELDNVSFTYREGEPDAVPALRDLRLEIEPGELVAIIGHNGSGKSTLVKLLSAVLYPTEGNVYVDGMPVDREHRWDVRRKVSVVFQDPDDQLIMNRVIDDVAFGPENLGLPREEIEERVRSSLRMLGLEEIGGRLIEDLSPGQKQRVAIAGALAMRPLFLILDEPPAEVLRDIEKLRQVGLDVPLAASLAHRLRARGIPIREDILNTSDLRTALSAAVDPSPSG